MTTIALSSHMPRLRSSIWRGGDDGGGGRIGRLLNSAVAVVAAEVVEARHIRRITAALQKRTTTVAEKLQTAQFAAFNAKSRRKTNAKKQKLKVAFSN